MSQELQYIVRVKANEGDIKNVKDRLDAIHDTKGKGTKSSRKGESDEIRELKLQLDSLTKSYLKNSKTLADLNIQIKGYKTQIAELNAVKKANGSLTREQEEQEVALRTSLKDTQADYRTTERELVANQVASEALGNSYNEMRQQMAALSVEIRNVQDPLGEGSETVARLSAKYDELNTKLKTVDQSMGNHQRNVGNYESSIRAAANAVAIFQGPLGPLAGRINATATAISRFTQAQRASNVPATMFGKVLSGNIPLIRTTAGSLTAKGRAATVANVGIKALNVGLKATRVALVALGIGAIIIAITSLISFFKKTEEGQQKLRVITAGLSAAFSVFADRASALGKAIFQAVTQPRQALENFRASVVNLGRTLLAEVIERFIGMRKVVSGVAENIASRFGVLSARIKLIVADTPLIGGFVDTEKAQKQLDENLSKIEESAEKIKEGFQQAFDPTFIVEFAKNVKDSIAETFDEITERSQQARRLQEEMNNVLVRERDLLVERAQMDKDMAEARAKARDMDLDAQTRLENLLKVKNAEKELVEKEIELEQDKLRIMQEQLNLSESTEEEKRAVAEQEAKLFKLQENHHKRMMSFNRDELAIQRQIREDEQRLRRLNFELEQDQREFALSEEIRLLEQQHRHVEAAQLRLNEVGINQQERYLNALQDLLDQDIEESTAKELARKRVDLEIAQERVDAQTALEEAQRANREQLFDAYIDLTKNALSAVFGDSKEIAGAQALIDTYAGVNKALASSAPPLNFVNAAAVLAAGIANVRKIYATKPGSQPSSQSVQAPSVSEQFRVVGSEENPLRAVAQSARPPSQDTGGTVNLELNVIDSENLAQQVRQGNNTLSSRGISIRTK